MIIEIRNFKMIGNPEGVKYVCHPFGILFRTLHILYNHINPSDLENPVIGFHIKLYPI